MWGRRNCLAPQARSTSPLSWSSCSRGTRSLGGGEARPAGLELPGLLHALRRAWNSGVCPLRRPGGWSSAGRQCGKVAPLNSRVEGPGRTRPDGAPPAAPPARTAGLSWRRRRRRTPCRRCSRSAPPGETPTPCRRHWTPAPPPGRRGRACCRPSPQARHRRGAATATSPAAAGPAWAGRPGQTPAGVHKPGTSGVQRRAWPGVARQRRQLRDQEGGVGPQGPVHQAVCGSRQGGSKLSAGDGCHARLAPLCSSSKQGMKAARGGGGVPRRAGRRRTSAAGCPSKHHMKKGRWLYSMRYRLHISSLEVCPACTA